MDRNKSLKVGCSQEKQSPKKQETTYIAELPVINKIVREGH